VSLFIERPIAVGAYSASKAALNSLTRKAHFENEWLGRLNFVLLSLNSFPRLTHSMNDVVTFPLAPGIVKSDMGTFKLLAFISLPFLGLLIWLASYPFVYIGSEQMQRDTTGTFKKLVEQFGMSVEEASEKLVDIIDSSTREKEGGQFVNFDGGRIAW
jgi:hypothetical protein